MLDILEKVRNWVAWNFLNHPKNHHLCRGVISQLESYIYLIKKAENDGEVRKAIEDLEKDVNEWKKSLTDSMYCSFEEYMKRKD